MTDEPRYDVAFSFLSANESLALRVSDGLGPRLSTFVYSREQPEVIGRNTDGVEAFMNTFRYECRVCVVLHSNGWGASGYTHIEEAAIKERALEHGWDFLIVVCVDDAKPPKWIPTTKIWYGFAKYGLEGLLGTIDNRVTELGGRPKEDALLERIARAQREREFSNRRFEFSRSPAAFKDVEKEFARLEQLLVARIRQLNAAAPSFEFAFAQSDSPRLSIAACSKLGSFVLYWKPASDDILQDAYLVADEWDGRFRYSGRGYDARKVDGFSAEPTIDYANRIVWDVDPLPLTSEGLLDHLFERLLERRNPTPGKRRAPFS